MASGKKSVVDLMNDMSEQHRRMVAEGIATMHRFATKPVLKDAKPKYQGNTVEKIAHLKAKRGS
jgi:CO dehydrogenase/acetyl-CoA synthase delta subunit